MSTTLSPVAATSEEVRRAYTSQRAYFEAGHTRSYQFRVAQLRKLKAAIKAHEADILAALHADMHKPEFEAFVSEVGVMYEEIDHTLKHLRRWMKPRRVGTPLVHFPSRSRIVPEPLGVVLVLGPWNYPFQLLLAPLVGAIAAGNCAVIKPSNQTPTTSALVHQMIAETFDPAYISVVEMDGYDVIPQLIEPYRFDHIFFTGSVPVGKLIMAAAAPHLTPVTLELGGKSPVVVDETADLEVTARRLTWAKFFNAGQTCVCPDYLLVHDSVKDRLADRMKHYIVEFFGEDPSQSPHLTHIVNDKRFRALTRLMEGGRIVHGGRSNPETRYLEPTLIDEVSLDDPIMQEEIFGPILPILTYQTLDEVVRIVGQNPHPLAFYLFTKNKATEKFLTERIAFGGGCINNALVHLANPNLPFGGVGSSGMGRYHGKDSFDVFSHPKSLLKTGFWYDNRARYAPYTSKNMKFVRRFFK